MPNDMVTAGHGVPQVEFPSSVLPLGECAQQYLLGLRQVQWIVVYGPSLSLLGGPYRFTVFRSHLLQTTLAILKWFSPF
jgi:hypothetical protein